MPERKFQTEPLYEQVRKALLQRISEVHWKPGELLPNEHELARELGVSPGTTRKALDILEREQVLLRQQGRGTTVVDQSTVNVARFSNLHDKYGRKIEQFMTLLSQSDGDANEAERKK